MSSDDLVARLLKWRDVRREIDEATHAGQHPNTELLTEAAKVISTLTDLGQALVEKLDRVTEDSAGVFQHAAMHHYEYRGAQYGEELEAFRAALSKVGGVD